MDALRTPPLFLPATITVSGQPPIAGVMWSDGSRALATAVHTHELVDFRVRQQRAVGAVKSERVRCGSCKTWTPRETAGEVLAWLAPHLERVRREADRIFRRD